VCFNFQIPPTFHNRVEKDTWIVVDSHQQDSDLAKPPNSVMRVLSLFSLLFLSGFIGVAMGSSPSKQELFQFALLALQRTGETGESFTPFDWVCFSRLNSILNPSPAPKRARKYKRIPGRTWQTSPYFQKYLRAPQGYFEDAGNVREFRDNFRMSWQSFCFLINVVREEKFKYDEDRTDAIGRPVACLELMVLSYLALMGDTIKVSQMETLTHLKAQTHRNFFKRFNQFGGTKLYRRFVNVESTAEGLRVSMKPFTMAGFPGCVGASDGVHVELLACPNKYTNLSTGKEGYPSRVWNCTCDFSDALCTPRRGIMGATTTKPLWSGTRSC
jgi:hypothetical protein